MERTDKEFNMKVEWNVKYTTIAVYSFIVIALGIVFYLIASQINVFRAELSRFLSFLQPFYIGAALAYILNFILEYVELNLIKRSLPKLRRPKVYRALSLIVTYTLFFALCYLFVSIIFPQLISSITKLITEVSTNFDSIVERVTVFIESLNIRQDIMKQLIDWWNNFLTEIFKFISDLVPVLGIIVSVVLASVWNIVLGVIISVYILLEKERFKALVRKINRAIFSHNRAERLVELTNRADHIFGRFISGKLLDSLIIAIITYITLVIFKMPFALLVSFIVGVTNIIPFFGPFIGMVPSFFIILIVSPIKALWFLLILLIIQQIDGNIIGPKILGDSIGISPFWILFSLLVAGKILGFIGLVIGVPLFAFVYSIVKDNVEKKLQKRGLPTDTKAYQD